MKRTKFIVGSSFAVVVLGVAAAAYSAKLREKFNDCFIIGVDEGGGPSLPLGGEGPGKVVEDTVEETLTLKCKAKVQNLSGEKQEITGFGCESSFLSDGAEVFNTSDVVKVSKKGRAKLFCLFTRDDVVPP